MVNEACQIVFMMKTVLGEEGKHFFKTRTTKSKLPQLWARDERERDNVNKTWQKEIV